MKRWTKVLVSLLALGGLPAMAADTTAQAKDRARENEIHARMKAREHTKKGKTVQGRADQAADAARAGGSRAARTYHGALHSSKKGVHRLSRKTEKKTQ